MNSILSNLEQKAKQDESSIIIWGKRTNSNINEKNYSIIIDHFTYHTHIIDDTKFLLSKLNKHNLQNYILS